MKTLLVPCFSFTLGTTGIVPEDKSNYKIDSINTSSILAAVQKSGAEKLILIGPASFTQRIKQEILATEYSHLQIELMEEIR
jgi:hypothetical protein